MFNKLSLNIITAEFDCYKVPNTSGLEPNLLLGITHLFPHNELVHLPYIAVATNTRAD